MTHAPETGVEFMVPICGTGFWSMYRVLYSSKDNYVYITTNIIIIIIIILIIIITDTVISSTSSSSSAALPTTATRHHNTSISPPVIYLVTPPNDRSTINAVTLSLVIPESLSCTGVYDTNTTANMYQLD